MINQSKLPSIPFSKEAKTYYWSRCTSSPYNSKDVLISHCRCLRGFATAGTVAEILIRVILHLDMFRKFQMNLPKSLCAFFRARSFFITTDQHARRILENETHNCAWLCSHDDMPICRNELCKKEKSSKYHAAPLHGFEKTNEVMKISRS